MELPELQKRLQRLNAGELLNRAVLDNKEEIIDANTAQLAKGTDAFGNFLEEYAFESYAKFKKALGSNAPLGVPNLLLEGDFYSGFHLIVDGENYIITSSDEKTSRLTAKYGVDIFGLSEESLQQIRPMILETWLKLIRHELFR